MEASSVDRVADNQATHQRGLRNAFKALPDPDLSGQRFP